jgi:hypothetical protein
VDSVYIGFERQGYNLVDAKIRVNRRLSLADQIRFVSLVAMQGELILFGIESNGAYTKLSAGSKDTDSNFTSIGRHDFTKSVFFHVVILLDKFI